MGTRIGPMYRQLEKEADRLRKNGAGGEADKLYGQASQMRLNRSSNIAASGENQAERVGYAAGQAGLVESQRRSQLEQQKLDREAQAQTTRLVGAQAGALESQNRGGVGTKPSIAPNAPLASTPRPGAPAVAGPRGFVSKPSIDGNPLPDSIQRPGLTPTAKPSLAAQPREGLIDGKPASETLGNLRGANDAPGNLADLRKTDAGSRQDAIDAARNESAGNASVTRGSVIDRINKDRESKGLAAFGDDIYKDIAKADSSNAASDRKFGSQFELAQKSPATGIPTRGLSEYRAPYAPAVAPVVVKPTAEVVANPSIADPAEGKGAFRRKDGSVPAYVVPSKLPLYAANSPSAKPNDDLLTKRPWKRTY